MPPPRKATSGPVRQRKSAPAVPPGMALVAALRALPPQTSNRFPPDVREVVEQMHDPEPTLQSILDDTAVEPQVRFYALYGLLLRLRREERYREYTALVSRYERDFGSEPYFDTFRAIIARMRGDTSSLRMAVEYSRHAAAQMPDVAGVLHQLASFEVEYLERVGEPVRKDTLDQTEGYVDRAIALSHGTVAHYFETKGRVLALREEFEAARTAVAQAVELEPKTTRDYVRNLTQYQSTRVRIDLLELRARWTRGQEAFKSELSEFKGQQLQLLGLLAAVVAFITTASGIASQIRGPDGVRLMVVAAGAVSVVFAIFAFLNGNRPWRAAIAAAIGGLMMSLGMFTPVSWIH